MTTSASPYGSGLISRVVDVDSGQIKSTFNAARLERGLTHLCTERLTIATDCLERLAALGCRVAQTERDYDGELYLLGELVGSGLVYLNVEPHGDNAYLSVACATPAVASAELARLADALRVPDTDDQRVALRLWNTGSRGATFRRRVVDAPMIDAIEGNYPAELQAQLRSMLDIGQDDVGGLALWYGPPGTGKTTAVRALALAWRPWCDVHVVVDPEALLTDPGYLMKVITERAFEDDLPADAVRSERRSRLVVLEDAGELLAADARAATGQGLSRILNVTDGLVGQGLSTSILITTNEEIGTLHPAIRRPGRCWAQARFGRFSGQEARAWLEARDIHAAGVTGSRSLAELFALERGEVVEEERMAFGFQA
jgi:hypothetical protein